MSKPSPKKLSERLEAVRRTLRASGKIGTESPENYELVSILNGIAGLEGQSIEGLRKQIESLKIEIIGAFQYQGPPSKHWLDTKGKEWEAHNKAIDKVLDLLNARLTITVNEEWMDCPCGCGCVFLGHDGSLVTCPKHQTEGEKRLLKESVEVRSNHETEPR